MTEDEARRIQRIANQADGGCPNCAQGLLERLQRAWPEHAASFQDEFDIEYEQ